MKSIKTLFLILCVIIASSCGTKENTEDSQKLLDQAQTQIKKQPKKEIATISALEIDQKKVENARLQLTRDSLQYELNKVNVYINQLGASTNELLILQDSLKKSNNVLNSVDKNAETSLSKGIAEIDERLSQLERQELKSERIAQVSKKRIALIDRKIDVLNEEIQLLEDDKTIALRDRNASNRLAIESEIRLIKMQIQTEQEKSAKATKGLEYHQAKILDLVSQQNKLQTRIGKDYDAQLLVDDFMESEKDRVIVQLEGVQVSLSNIEKQRDNLAQTKSLLVNQIIKIDAKINDISDRQLVQLDRQLSDELNTNKVVTELSKSDIQESTKRLQEADKVPNELEENIKGLNGTVPIIIGIILLFIILFVVGKRKRTK